MKRLLFILMCLYSVCTGAQEMPGNNELMTVPELAAYNGPATKLLVADELRGGTFRYTKDKHVIDSGIVFPGYNKGYWVRVYDKNAPVNLSWFGAHMDSVTDDGIALKNALKYPSIRIDGLIAINGKTVIPAGKTIEFSEKGGIVLNDTLPLKFEAQLKADDFRQIFYGKGDVILGTNSAHYVSACWLGAAADCAGFTPGKGTDNTQAIQKAIFAAQKVSDLYLPPAPANMSYRITSTITISKKLHFFSFRFHGGGNTVTFSSGDRATNLFADMTANAAINIQGCRRTYITDMAIKGLNKLPSTINGYDGKSANEGVDDPHTFTSPGISDSYTAITTDVEKDSKVWSADIVFQNLLIYNFYLGIGISHSGHVQGDRMRVEQCQINDCIYGISVGNAQNRACHFIDVDMTRVWCGVTNTTFGDHSGSMFQITGGQWCHVYKPFIIQPSYLGQCVISGLYTEAIGCIGIIGNHNPNNSSVLFTGCYFFMRDEGLHDGSMFLPPFYTLWTYGNVTFEGCNFWAGRHTVNMFAGSATGGYNGSAITMTGCSIVHCTDMHIKGNAIIDNTYFNPISEEMNYNRHITADLEGNKRYQTGYSAESVISGMEYNSAENATVANNRKIIRTIPRFYTTCNGGGDISGMELKHDSITFNYSSALQAPFFRYVLPGDMLGTTLKNSDATGWDNPTLRIVSVDTIARKVSAIALTNKLTFDKIGLYTNSFFVTKPIYGHIANGSNTITNIENAGMLRSGDFITFAGAGRTYRIGTVDTEKKTAVLLNTIEGTTTGRQELYNEQLAVPMPPAAAPNNSLRTVKEDVSISPDDQTIIANTADNDISVMLPAAGQAGHIFYIKKYAAAHSVIIKGGTTTIDGQSTYTLKDNYQGLQVQYDGKNYLIIR